MRLSRRALLTLIPLSAAAATVAASPIPPPTDAEHVIGDWRVRWSNWKEHPSQMVKFGYWFAWSPHDRGYITLCTHLGRLQRVPEFGVIDLTRAEDGYPLSVFDTPERFEASKWAAYATLRAALLARPRGPV